MAAVAARLPSRRPGVSDSAAPADNRWVLLALQLPARPSNARVKTWRRLQQLGAVAVKHAVYVLPRSAQALEDFSWLRTEIESLGGHASVFSASAIDKTDDTDIIEQFTAARSTAYKQLLADVRRCNVRGRQSEARLREMRLLRERFEHERAIDFFSAPGCAEVDAALTALERDLRRPPAPVPLVPRDRGVDRHQFTGRTWITRPRPGVDRFACAWLIRRFIDPAARFVFASNPAAVPDAVPYDMYDSGFRHEGERCTFEVLALTFGIRDTAVQRVGEIVHDVDLKDNRFHSPQAPTLATLVEGLRASIADDEALLAQGMAVVEALYQGLRGLKPASPKVKR